MPPEKPVIYDGRRREATTSVELSYNEGSDVSLICQVHGGEYSILPDIYLLRLVGDRVAIQLHLHSSLYIFISV